MEVALVAAEELALAPEEPEVVVWDPLEADPD